MSGPGLVNVQGRYYPCPPRTLFMSAPAIAAVCSGDRQWLIWGCPLPPEGASKDDSGRGVSDGRLYPSAQDDGYTRAHGRFCWHVRAMTRLTMTATRARMSAYAYRQ